MNRSAPARVLQVCLHTDPYAEPGSGDVGGMNVVVRHSAEALAARGHQVEIVTRRTDPDAETVSQPAPGVRLHRVAVGPARPVAKGDHEGFIEEFRTALSSMEPADVVHSHHWFSGMAALPVSRLWGVAHVQSFHSIAADPATSLAEGERPESPGRLAGEAMLAKDSDLVVAVSRAEAETVAERLGGSHIELALPGVDAELFRPGTGPGSHAVVAARLEPLKGIDLAIESLGAVPAEYRPPLVVAGGATTPQDPYVDKLAKLAVDHAVAATFTGPQSRTEVAATLREARVLLVPSFSETYGLVALEAAASGTPVIASDTGGLREAVVDGKTGVLMGTRDPQEWARIITRVVREPDLALHLGDAGRRHALRHTWDETAGHLLTAYRTVLNRVR